MNARSGLYNEMSSSNYVNNSIVLTEREMTSHSVIASFPLPVVDNEARPSVMSKGASILPVSARGRRS